MVVWAWVRRRRQTWQAVLAGAAPVVVAGLTIFWRYGSALPNSVSAKQVAYQSAWPFENAVALLVQAGLPGWSTHFESWSAERCRPPASRAEFGTA